MASELALPANVIGIIADCPYFSPEAIIRKVCREDMRLPPALVMPFVRLGARLFGHFDLKESSAVQAVANTNIPILLLHGEDDRFVPCNMSRDIFGRGENPHHFSGRRTWPELYCGHRNIHRGGFPVRRSMLAKKQKCVFMTTILLWIFCVNTTSYINRRIFNTITYQYFFRPLELDNNSGAPPNAMTAASD